MAGGAGQPWPRPGSASDHHGSLHAVGAGSDEGKAGSEGGARPRLLASRGRDPADSLLPGPYLRAPGRSVQ